MVGSIAPEQCSLDLTVLCLFRKQDAIFKIRLSQAVKDTFSCKTRPSGGPTRAWVRVPRKDGRYKTGLEPCWEGIHVSIWSSTHSTAASSVSPGHVDSCIPREVLEG